MPTQHGWRLQLAVEDADDGHAWAISAVDAVVTVPVDPAHDELGRQAHLRGRPPSRSSRTSSPAQPAAFAQRLTHRGQRRVGVGGGVDVVEPGDRRPRPGTSIPSR